MTVETGHRFPRRVVATAARALGVVVLALLLATLASAPARAQKGCAWFGSPPFCDGQCPAGHVYTGKREACTTGSRRFCCPAHYVTPGVNCKWVGQPGHMLYVCDDPILKFHVRNDCPVTVSVQVQYKPRNSAHWQTNNYRFAPGESGYLVDTKNRYVYVTAEEVGGPRRWARHQVDLGGKLGQTHTHVINCR